MNIDKVAEAIEHDAGQSIDGLKESLKEMKAGKKGRVYTTEQLLVTSARKKVSLSQTAFANLINTPVATLRDWEQGRFQPPGGVLCLLKIINKRPDIIDELAV